jgi:cell division protein FtsL
MDETSLLILQNEISELEKKLADKKHRLEEALVVFENQTSDQTIMQKSLSKDLSQTSPIEINNNSSSKMNLPEASLGVSIVLT